LEKVLPKIQNLWLEVPGVGEFRAKIDISNTHISSVENLLLSLRKLQVRVSLHDPQCHCMLDFHPFGKRKDEDSPKFILSHG